MELKEKAQIIKEVAMAYYDRGEKLQYDQRCMDRTMFLTPRRIKLIPPEAATSQKTIYLDCSSFVGAVFYEAFGYELPSDLTWHMIDYVTPRVYYYEFTKEETERDFKKIEKDIRDCLIAGDVIIYDRGIGSGHTMIYLGDNKIIHCTPNGRPDSYDYVNCKSREYEAGLFIDDISDFFNDKKLFSPKIRRVSISRPLLELDTPSARTLARVGEQKGLYMEVTSSHCRTINAKPFEEVEYYLNITEKSGIARKLELRFMLPVEAVGDTARGITLSPYEKKTVTFKAKVIDNECKVLENVKIYVGDFEVFVPDVLIGERLTKEEAKTLLDNIDFGVGNALTAVAAAYEKLGIFIEKEERKVINKLFYLHDAPSGDVLSRRKQNPSKDGAVYSFFGGTGVVTPEMISSPFIRVNQVALGDFLTGDIIVLSDDACADKTYSAVFTGDGFTGYFSCDTALETKNGEQAAEFVDSLIGRFCFVVLRPALLK